MQPQVQSLDEILANLDPAYAPSRDIFNKQLGLLPGEEASTIAGLDAGKQNAFRDINTGANSKGLAFSGIPGSEQARYLGEKYLPAVANAKAATTNKGITLQGALADLEKERRLKATDTQTGQQGRLDTYLEQERQRQFQAQQAAEDRAFQERQNDLNRRLTASRDAAAGGGSTDISVRKNANGGWDVVENGQISRNYDLNAYARLTGKNIVDLLRNGDAKDRQAAAWYDQKIKKYGTKDQAKYLAELKRDRSSAFYLGG